MKNIKRKNSFFGGVVNKTVGKDNFDSIIKMLSHESCEITNISYSSQKGFLFKIHVKNLTEQDGEFYGLNETTNTFDTLVDTLVMKLAVLYTGTQQDERVLDLPEYKEQYKNQAVYEKQMEYFADFENEAIVQSEIYEKTLIKGQPICPALIDFSHFTSLDSSIPFLNILEARCVMDDESTNMIKYIKSVLSSVRDCQLGVITMESAVNFDSFYDTFDSYSVNTPDTMVFSGANNAPPADLQVQLCNDVVVQIIRLLNECRIVHCDMHGYNVLVKKSTDSSSHKIFIIDFGRILHIDKLTNYEKKVTEQYAKTVFMTRTFFKFSSSNELEFSPTIATGITKFDKNFVKTIIQFIMSVDFMYNKTKFDRESQSKIQKTYVNNLNRLASYNVITDRLNKYYSIDITCSIEEMAKYKSVNALDQHNKDVNRFETLCHRMEDVKGSPSKYKFVARDAPELVRMRKKRQTSSRSDKNSDMSLSSKSSRSTRKSNPLKSIRFNSNESSDSMNSFGNVATRFDFNLSNGGKKSVSKKYNRRRSANQNKICKQ